MWVSMCKRHHEVRWGSLWTIQCNLTFQSQPNQPHSQVLPHSEEKSLWVYLPYTGHAIERWCSEQKQSSGFHWDARSERGKGGLSPPLSDPIFNASMKVYDKQENSPPLCDLLFARRDWQVSYADKAASLCVKGRFYLQSNWQKAQTFKDPRPSRVCLLTLLVCPSVSSISLLVCLSSLQIFSNSIINTRNLTPLKTFTNTLQPCLMALKRRKWGWGKQGVGGCSQFLWSQSSHSLKTHGIGFSASPLGGKSWEFLTSFGVKAAGLSLCVSEWSQSLIAKGKWSENTLCLVRLITCKISWKDVRK